MTKISDFRTTPSGAFGASRPRGGRLPAATGEHATSGFFEPSSELGEF
jgi:hypothetical protein